MSLPQISCFTEDALEIYKQISNIWPAIIRKNRQNKLLFMLDLLMKSRDLKRVSKDLMLEAARLVMPKSYDPLFHMFEDMEKFKKTMLEPFTDIKAYNKIPIRLKRWKSSRKNPHKPVYFREKVLAFCASPRKKGNTDLIIEEVLRGARDAGAHTEKYMLQKMKMGYCIGCRKCKDPDYDKICAIVDDMTPVYEKIMEADAVVIGFPIYTGREAAQLSTFLDRWDGFERYLLKSSLKPGRTAMVIGTWGYPYIDTYDHVIENIITILNLHHVETTEAISACGFEGMLHGLDKDRKGVIAGHPKLLNKAYEAGKDLVIK